MRFSNIQAFSQNLQGSNRLQAENAHTQQQIASGRRVLTPSDDPIASARIVQVQEELALSEQYRKNIDSVNSHLGAEEQQIETATNTLIRIRELTIQAGDGALSFENRKTIATELRQNFDHLVSVANSRGADGEYIFAGYQSAEQPFVRSPDGNIDYAGDEGQRFVKVSATTTLATNDGGKALFMDVSSANNTFTAQPHPRNSAQPPALISAKAVVDQAAYDSFYPEDLRVEFNDPPTTFNIVQKSDGATLLTGEPYQNGEDINIQGLQFSIVGAPAAGDQFFIESSSKQSVFKTVGDLITGLETLDDSIASNEPRQALLAASLDNLDNAHDAMLTVRTSIGARMNIADSTASMHEDLELLSQQVLSEERDLDYAEAISRLSFQSFVLEAAQQSFARVSNLSLFNFLR